MDSQLCCFVDDGHWAIQQQNAAEEVDVMHSGRRPAPTRELVIRDVPQSEGNDTPLFPLIVRAWSNRIPLQGSLVGSGNLLAVRCRAYAGIRVHRKVETAQKDGSQWRRRLTVEAEAEVEAAALDGVVHRLCSRWASTRLGQDTFCHCDSC